MYNSISCENIILNHWVTKIIEVLIKNDTVIMINEPWYLFHIKCQRPCTSLHIIIKFELKTSRRMVRTIKSIRKCVQLVSVSQRSQRNIIL